MRWARRVGSAVCVLFLAGGTFTGAAQAEPEPSASTRGGDHAFADAAWHLVLGGQSFVEAWNYNTSREELHGGAVGLAYGVRERLQISLEWPVLYVLQRSASVPALAMTAGVRWQVAGPPGAPLFVETAVGAARADVPTPPGGTRVNYLLVAGAGVMRRAGRLGHLHAGLRWLHVSNNSLAGRDRNPDIQAIGVHAGLLLPF
jgi:hypothetical protein